MTAFGTRLRAALDAHGPLCVGIDPHEHLLTEWGVDVSASGVREFGLRVVEAASGRAGVVKPQVAFFERFGSAGFAALEDVLSAARAETVKAYLVQRGIPAAALATSGVGPDRPVADNATASGRARNRRIEFRVLA